MGDWQAARVSARDEILDTLIRILRRQRGTKALGARAARAIDVVRAAEARETEADVPDDAGDVLLELARDRARRLFTQDDQDAGSLTDRDPKRRNVALKRREQTFAAILRAFAKDYPRATRDHWRTAIGTIARSAGRPALPLDEIDDVLAARNKAQRLLFALYAQPDQWPSG